MSKSSRPFIGVTGHYVRHTDRPGIAAGLCDEHTLLAPYFDSVIQAGGLPLLIPATSDPDLTAEYLDRVAGVLFTGCRQDYPPAWYSETNAPETITLGPPRADSDRRLMNLALHCAKPLMGICAGFQLYNICSGGSLIQHVQSPIRHTIPPPAEEAYHEVTLEAQSQLADILGAMHCRVNSNHHQAVDLTRIAPTLRPVAMAADGVVEALEPADTDAPFRLFVQWHPERIDDTVHKAKLFSAFVAACG